MAPALTPVTTANDRTRPGGNILWSLSQAVAGYCYLCLGFLAFCLTLLASVVDSCIFLLVPSRGGLLISRLQQTTPREVAGEPQSATICRGPAGMALKLGHGMAGAGCGVLLALYRACFTAHTSERSNECVTEEHWVGEQGPDSTELHHA